MARDPASTAELRAACDIESPVACNFWGGVRGLRAACFTEGTQVVTGCDEHGQAITKNIEDLRKGDLVVSRDEHDPNAELELREVQDVFVRRVYELQVISIEDNETGEKQQINATGEHPFWVNGKGWTRADELRLGDQVQNPDGTCATVTSNVVQVHAGGVTVYNIEVRGGHTYFVAEGVGEASFVWVHNAKCARVRAGSIDSYYSFKKRSVSGDDLQGHELLQHAWLKAHGHATTRLSTEVSKANPVIALRTRGHLLINPLQDFDLKAQSAVDNILANRQIMLDLGFSRKAVNKLTRRALDLARKFKL